MIPYVQGGFLVVADGAIPLASICMVRRSEGKTLVYLAGERSFLSESLFDHVVSALTEGWTKVQAARFAATGEPDEEF